MLTVFYFLFGLLSIAGGAMGYARAKSRPSLIAGAITGALLIIAGLLGRSPSAYALATAVSLLLLIYFGRTYLVKKKPMPALPMVGLSLICVVWTLAVWLR